MEGRLMAWTRAGLKRAAAGTVAIAATVAVVLAGCSSGGKGGSGSGDDQASKPRSPITTTDGDWKPVADVLGRTGKLGDNNTAYRVALVRNDLRVTTDGVAIQPGLSLGGHAAFVRYDNEALLMGDLVVTEAELPKVTDALQAHGLAQTALHKHLLQQTPPVWWIHIHGMGDATQLAQGLKAALDATSIGPATPPPVQQPPVDIDTAGVQQALGRKGTPDSGLFKYSTPRTNTIVEDGYVLPAAALNLTTGINFQPVGGGRAAINGDFILTAPEVQKVIQALRRRQHPDRRIAQPRPDRTTSAVLHALLGCRRRGHARQGVAPGAGRHQPAARITAMASDMRIRRGWAMLVVAALITACATNRPMPQQGSDPPLPLRPVAEVPLPGDNSRFDYVSLDKQRGLLFIAHLGASEVVEVDVRAGRVVRTIPNISQVHGVLVVGTLNRVYATATGGNQVVALDETTGAELGRAPTGNYPDGRAYDPRRNTVWTTNESAGTETVVDAATLQLRGTVELGGQVGNVGYDQDSDRMLVAVQGRNDLAVIDPAAMTVVQRVALPGCDHPHGLAVDGPDRLVFVACEGNATLVTVDQTTWKISGTNPVGEDPDVLAYDNAAHRLYVAAESGTVTTLDLHDHSLAVSGSGHLADGAHVVAVDIDTHRSYYPVPAGRDGHPALLEREPT
jgi:Domain of Unknown Function (DUF1259)